ncbi:hypothetical protein [Mycobacteroides abscessus]|uniref:hypothetical protein n=1 Tax=Mycobacteroides abscessus TaxID=36809 RepID=UPI0005EA376A|nr:hypothetical protein [Mycobacteroides abscessus]MBN7458221.1 hypothetical protein [Mycobacteroides abscessus subsp. abscessus]MBN7547027.1 hypothetical protein [Mycobacteroides abscessus subsp. abscessus]MBN7572153.1 hypothetical protein [Mycobacteroides abscessus subsp. abscessus]QSM97052.1 hypothetical protein I3U31_25770 [Mycobacteroides abscessus subsp. abscessus]QSN02088.1 hypothetical protein I3U40_25775 [Mycobacteroides abscessus subsp. abscessus]
MRELCFCGLDRFVCFLVDTHDFQPQRRLNRTRLKQRRRFLRAPLGKLVPQAQFLLIGMHRCRSKNALLIRLDLGDSASHAPGRRLRVLVIRAPSSS